MKFITLVAKDYRGLIADITECLTQHQLNIESINAEQAGTTALISIQTIDNDTAFQVLSDEGFHLVSRAGLLIKIKDEPGSLAKVSRKLSDKNVDIRGMNMVEQHDGFNIVALSCSDELLAGQTLREWIVPPVV